MKIMHILGTLCLLIWSTVSFAINPMIAIGNPDGTKWQSKSGPDHSIMYAVTQNNKDLIAVGSQVTDVDENIAVFKSLDAGSTWNLLSGYLKADGRLTHVIANNGNLVALGTHAQVLYSADNGAAWTKPVSLPEEASPNRDVIFHAIASNGKTLFAAGNYLMYPGSESDWRPLLLMKSDDDGKTWQSLSASLPKGIFNEGIIKAITWDGTQWIMAGRYSASLNENPYFLMTSSDSKNWNLLNLNIELHDPTDIIIKGKEWTIYDGLTHRILKSHDQGKTWDKPYSPFPYQCTYQLKIQSNGQSWVAAGGKYSGPGCLPESLIFPVMYASKDGIHWKQQPLPHAIITYLGHAVFNDVLWNGSNWVAVGSYVKPESGCRSYGGLFIGTLKAGATQATVKQFGFTTYLQATPSNKYETGGAIGYNTPHGEFFYGMDGICTEAGGIAKINVKNKETDAYFIAQKPMDGNTIQILQSHLISENGYVNFTGTLKRY